VGNRRKPLTRATRVGARSSLPELLIAEDYSNDFCLIQEKSASSGMTLVSGATQDSRRDSLVRVSKGGGPFWPPSPKVNGVTSCVDPASQYKRIFHGNRPVSEAFRP
jgi:hypothetical protein